MSFNSQRQFQLFEITPIRDPNFGTDTPLYSDPTLSAVTPLGNGTIAIAVRSVYIQTIDLKTPASLAEFKAYGDDYQITYLEYVKDGMLVSVGECVGKPTSIKIWNLGKTPKDAFDFHSTCEVRNGNNTFPVSAISLSQDLSCIVLGFVNGRIILVRGDLYRDRGSRQRIIYEDLNNEPITALFLNNDYSVTFASTTSRIMLFRTTGRNNGEPERVLNANTGIDLNCSCFNPERDELLCCLDKSVEFYKATGEKHSLLVEVPMKKRIFLIDNDHILLLSSVSTPNSTALQLSSTGTITKKVLILDLKNQLIAMNHLLASNIVHIYSDTVDGVYSVYLVTTDGVINRITEKPVDKQIKLITQRELYPIALQLAEQRSVSPLRIQEIRRQYGDALYKKNMKEEAVEQYIQCLDITETSEIISRFGIQKTSRPDDSRNLATYLWSMIKQKLSHSDHVTLLLAILIKLKDVDGIDYFISHFSRNGEFVEEGEDESSWSVDDETFFYSDIVLMDLDTILQLLKDSELDAQAFSLVHKFSKDPIQVVDVILNTLDDPHSALKYIKSLHVDDTLRVLIEFSKVLLEKLPNDTNALLIDVFTGRYQRSTKCEVNIREKKQTISRNNPVFHSYKAFVTYMYSTAGGVPNSEDIQEPTYHPPKPSLVFTSFIDRPFQFVVFLEACLESYNKFQGFLRDKQEILTTLYDIYLSLAATDEAHNEDWRTKATAVYKESEKLAGTCRSPQAPKASNTQFDNSLMMLISHINNVDLYSVEGDASGTEDLSVNKANLTNTFRSMCLTKEAKKCMNFLEKYGSVEPELYRMALGFFLSSKQVYDSIGGAPVFKARVLDKVIEMDLLQPLDILFVLSSTSVATFGLVRDFLINHIKAQQRETHNNEKLIQSYQGELQEKEMQLKTLLSESEPLQVKVKNNFCKMCHTLLDLPVIFFKCGHIYHQRCLPEDSISDGNGSPHYRCPNCAVDIEASENLIKPKKDNDTKASLLQAALSSEDSSGDRFKVVSEFIGKGGLEFGT
ncbi:ABL012Cp [Eremothecium gossypii ATCC 10895]|uniref:E3 ubiquitin-protein ligase PEP5 n=1 Tax=Eremothecium gossypii (strain ATCC 10895 / CBS 109.51 / FGSC 9923 / NRRL Y-1056) TaxID=284811 RepID=Q75DM9_EREGS|nr:ABL012Cp [Eremothecium gossypii ATCC 10895]AAS50759.2 ABL012Cp [Eremothecium gossypii ATCC 10895]AEY95048.1 FABL012Cp [Eremothecium gossypii FDAG1]